MNRILFIFAALILIPTMQVNARSQPNVDEHPLLVKTLDGFQTDSARIRHEMDAGGKYENIAAHDKARVDTRLNDMLKLLQNSVAKSDMTPDEKVKLANAQEEINGILTHNDNNRLICKREVPVGSHLPVTTCHTYAELAAQRRAMQHALQTDFRENTKSADGSSLGRGH